MGLSRVEGENGRIEFLGTLPEYRHMETMIAECLEHAWLV